MPDKFAATWVSHSSITDYRACPRAYYLKNVYKHPETGRKMKLMAPPLALGQAVHETLESIASVPRERRFGKPLVPVFEKMWEGVAGKRGGFRDDTEENTYKNRGRAMVKRVQDHPGPLANAAVKIKMDLPYYWLSEQDEIILCGRVDWIEYLPETDSVHIIDFKTGRNEEAGDSLQLPIYHLLVTHCQKRPVAKASYWYLETSDAPAEKQLPDITDAERRLLDIARKMKLARKLNSFPCPHEGCRVCAPMEMIVRGEAERVGVDDFNADVYILPTRGGREDQESVIL